MAKKLFDNEKTINSIKRMIEDKLTSQEIADCFEVGSQTISNFCRKHGIIANASNTIIPKYALLEVYNNAYLTTKEKAKALGVSVGLMYDNLAYNNIQLLNEKSDEYYFKNGIPRTDDEIMKILRTSGMGFSRKCSALNVKLSTLYILYDKYFLKRPYRLEQLMAIYNRVNHKPPKEKIDIDIEGHISPDSTSVEQETMSCQPCNNPIIENNQEQNDDVIIEEEAIINNDNIITEDNTNTQEIKDDRDKSNTPNNITVNLTLNFNINQASFDITGIIKQAVNSTIEQALKK